MSNAAQTTVIFACPKCGVTYRTTQSRTPEHRAGSFNCSGCNAEVAAWSGSYDYTDWSPYTKPRSNGTKH